MSGGYATQEQNTDLIDFLSVPFTRRNEPNFALANAHSTYKALPGLVGLWMCNSPRSSGAMNDDTNNDVHMTNNNSALFSNDELAPCIVLNGSNQYFNFADAAIVDITGTEAYIDNNGLSLGAWVNFDNAASATEHVIAKQSLAAGNISYALIRLATGEIRMSVSVDGTAVTTIASASTVGASSWTFVAGRFDPSTELAVWVNSEKTTNTTSIPASIFNGTADLEIGSRGGGNGLLDGKIALVFLCASALSDAYITNLYQQSRGLFGV